MKMLLAQYHWKLLKANIFVNCSLWSSEHHEHHKYIWNGIVLKGKSQLGMKKLNCKQQWKLVCDFEVSLHVLNFIIYDWSVHLLTCQNQIKVFMVFFFFYSHSNIWITDNKLKILGLYFIEVLSITFGSMINILGPPVYCLAGFLSWKCIFTNCLLQSAPSRTHQYTLWEDKIIQNISWDKQ